MGRLLRLALWHRVRTPIPRVDLERTKVNDIDVLYLGLFIMVLFENLVVKIYSPLVILKIFTSTFPFFSGFKKLRKLIVIAFADTIRGP